MDLKEYIKSLVRQQLEEESTTAGVPGYMTPFAFSKGKGKNAATKQAERSGWKVTKGETTMPSDSKLYDYKTLTGKKKKGVKIYEEEEPKFNKGDKVEYKGKEWTVNVDSKPGVVVLKSDSGTFTHAIPSQVNQIKENNSPKDKIISQIMGPNHPLAKKPESEWSKGEHELFNNLMKQAETGKVPKMNESLLDIIEQELLNEVTYSKFKNEVKYRTKAEQLHKAIREVKRKLQEIDRIVEYTQRMKTELSEGDGIQYWNRTNKAVAAISEMVNHLNNKIKNLNQ